MFKLFLITLAVLTESRYLGRQYVNVILQYFDKYDDMVTLASVGGYMMVTCITSDRTCPAAQFELIHRNGTKYESTNCNGGMGIMRINITEQTDMEWYQCAMAGITPELFPVLLTALCGDQSSYCQSHNGDTCDDENAFCMMTESGLFPCNTKKSHLQCRYMYEQYYSGLETALSMGLGKTYCPGGLYSLCSAIQTGQYEGALVEHQGRVVCPSRMEDNIRLEYNGEVRLFHEYIQIDPGHIGGIFEYHCPASSIAADASLTCVMKHSSSDTVFGLNISSCSTMARIQVAHIHGSGVYKLKCDFRNATGSIVATLSHFLVVLGGNLTVWHSPHGIGCQLDLAATNEITVKYWWTGQKTGVRIEGPILEPVETDIYVCNALVEYKSCSPYSTFNYTPPIVSVQIQGSLDVNIDVSSWTNAGKTVLIIGPVLAICIIAIAIYANKRYHIWNKLKKTGENNVPIVSMDATGGEENM